MNIKPNKTALIILDGWGIGNNNPKENAIAAAKTPFMDKLMATYPHSQLLTFGGNVGLPDGQMGNSEVGHINIGAGRVVYQQFAAINKSFAAHEIDNHPILAEAFEYAKTHHKKIHFIGLVSDGGVHSHIEHLKGLCTIAQNQGAENVFIHAFMDGRDTDPKGGAGYTDDLLNHIQNTNIKLASVIGRYYAMDRDKRWERTKLAYDLLVNGIGTPAKDALIAIEQSYADNVTDEFIKPIVIVDDNAQPIATIAADDVVVFFNFRTDRGRQLTIALTQQDFHEQNMHKMPLHFITFTEYDKTYQGIKILFPEIDLNMTLGEVLEKANCTQLRMAETEKYPHVTFFFSGGREELFAGEDRIMAQSPKVATYDLQPQMSAPELTQKAIDAINTTKPDFLVLNYANTDMVGHTGVFSAVVTAVETVDSCAEKLVATLMANNYSILITADHGNADYMVNADGTPNTAHTTNPVPLILIETPNNHTLKNGKLADLAPTILTMMGLAVPAQMTGENLRV